MPSREYSAPVLEEIGTFERLTQAIGCPDTLDAGFPAGTPMADLTCVEGGLS
jgi:hypothetical protein